MNGPSLGLDSATPYLALALWWAHEGRGVRASARVDRRVAAEIALRAEAFLRSHGVATGDLVGVGVGVGPGSYAGARVGVAWATGLSRALEVPLVGGDTLAARAAAWLAPGTEGEVAVEARRGEAWVAAWRRPADGPPLPLAPRRRVPLVSLPRDVRASLACPPDALVHARRVGAPGAEAPRVVYEPTPGT